MIKRSIQTISMVSSALTASGNSTDIFIDSNAETVLFELNLSAVSGTSPTLDLYLQQEINGSYIDICRFAQQTAVTTNKIYASFSLANMTKASDGIIGAVGNGTISANTTSGVPIISRTFRAKYTIGGTSPSFTTALTAYTN